VDFVMIPPDEAREPVERLAEEFLQRHRQGEQPSVTEYARRYPDLADEIRDFFPALLVLEEVGPRGAEPTTGRSRAPAPGRAPPEQLGEYRLLREVGRGGMGVVYEAEHRALGRHVALKVLPSRAALDPLCLQRFRREARAAARLHHTNIVPVFEVGSCDGVHYYAMQFIEGRALDDVLRQLRRARAGTPAPDAAFVARLAAGLRTGEFRAGPAGEVPPAARGDARTVAPAGPDALPLAGSEPASDRTPPAGVGLTTNSGTPYYRSVARVGLQVAEALAYAHAQNILHRDIKPANLLLDRQGTVWVTDFGLAKEEGDDLTRTGDVVGTLRYMAPERFRGQADPRSDVYSLGLTLYELLCLRPAFAGTDRGGLVKQIAEDEPPRPATLDPGVPRDLETIVLKTSAKEPARRYQSARELADDLECFLGDRPIQARRTAAWELAWRWCRRNPAVASLTAVVAMLLCAITVSSLLSMLRLDRELRRSTLAEQAEREARDDAVERLWQSLRAEAEARRVSRRPGQRLGALKALAEAAALAREKGMPAARLQELRNEAIACLALPDLRPAQQWPGWPAGSLGLSFDATLEHYARLERSQDAIIRRVADDAEIGRVPASGVNVSPLLSDDGRYCGILQIQDRRLKVWDLGPKAPALRLDVPGCVTFAFHPREAQVVVARSDNSISQYDLVRGCPTHELRADQQPTLLSFHRQACLLAFSAQEMAWVHDLHSSTTLAAFAHPAAVSGLTWHPSRTVLAVACTDGRIYQWDVRTHKPVVHLRGHPGGPACCFDPTGAVMASAGWDGLLRLSDTQTGQELFSTQAGLPTLRFRADGCRLAAEARNHQLRTWEVALTPEYGTLARAPSLGKVVFGEGAVSPDGRLLAVVTSEGVGFWDLVSREVLGSLRLGPTRSLCFDASGTLLTNGEAGLFRWPVQKGAGPAAPWQLGPPHRLPLTGTTMQVACSRDSRVVASARWHGATVLHADRTGRPLRLTPHADVRYVAVSPDGRWVATGSHGGVAKLWEAQTGTLRKELPAGETFARVGFSPDGHWLVNTAGGCRLWAVDGWREGPVVGGTTFAFSPDSRLLAVETGYGAVRLIDLKTAQEWGRLEDPHQSRASWIGFSPDAAQVIVATGEPPALHVWDLRLVRRQLADRGLDWDEPPLPPPPVREPIPSLRTAGAPALYFVDRSADIDQAIALSSFVLALNPFCYRAYVQRAEAFVRSSRTDNAVADYALALSLLPAGAEPVLGPELAEECAELAEAWVLAPGSRADPNLVLFLAREAVVLAPDEPAYRVTLGMVHARLQHFREAVAILEQSLQDGDGEQDGFALFFLALSYHGLGDAGRARTCHDRAVRWVSAQRRLQVLSTVAARELADLRNEAEAALGIARAPVPSQPKAPVSPPRRP
jgi:eukaryotic-like serine/threonine-protein kinase